MSVSYQFSQDNNFQSALWTAISTVANLVQRSVRLCAWLYACLPALLAGCAILARSLALVALCVAAFVAVAMVPPVFWLCLVGIVVAAYITFPRMAVAK